MENNNSEVIYCFSEGEFSILADVCGIKTMLCFSPRNGSGLRKLLSAEYKKTVFDLCRRGIVVRDGDSLIMDRVLSEMITRCRTCQKIICFRKTDEQAYTACIYLDMEKGFTLILPGRRKSEYIRISSHSDEELHDIMDGYMCDSDEAYVFDGASLEPIISMVKDNEDEYSTLAHEKCLKGD